MYGKTDLRIYEKYRVFLISWLFWRMFCSKRAPLYSHNRMSKLSTIRVDPKRKQDLRIQIFSCYTHNLVQKRLFFTITSLFALDPLMKSVELAEAMNGGRDFEMFLPFPPSYFYFFHVKPKKNFTLMFHFLMVVWIQWCSFLSEKIQLISNHQECVFPVSVN